MDWSRFPLTHLHGLTTFDSIWRQLIFICAIFICLATRRTANQVGTNYTCTTTHCRVSLSWSCQSVFPAISYLILINQINHQTKTGCQRFWKANDRVSSCTESYSRVTASVGSHTMRVSRCSMSKWFPLVSSLLSCCWCWSSYDWLNSICSSCWSSSSVHLHSGSIIQGHW